MMLIYKIAALVELVLVILENSGFVHLHWLPLGGGQIEQIGLVFATAYVAAELTELLKGAARSTASAARRARKRRHSNS
jgi:hypothetical protein